MADFDHLDARVYVDASISRDELLQQVARLLTGTAQRSSVSISCGEIEVRRNDEFDKHRRREFPNGFLCFSYFLEVYTRSEKVQCRPIVAQLLEYLWSQKFPAVATCDYEDELPHRGGFKNRAISWPNSEAVTAQLP